MRKKTLFSLFLLSGLAAGLPAAVAAQYPLPDLSGTWRVETPDGPREVIIRPDSSASFGEETVRWRLAADSLHIALGDEWMVYGYQLHGSKITLSGGDLEDPMDLEKIGPPTPRAEGVEVPPAPPADRRAIT